MDHLDAPIKKTFESITSGGEHLVMVTRQRIAQALDAMDAGDFLLARTHLGEGASTLNPLAEAQQYIAIADGNRLVRATELEAGMYLTQVGEVTAVNVEDCPTGGHVKVAVEGLEKELVFNRTQELFVVRT